MLTRRDTLSGLGGSLLLASMARGQDSPETQVLIRNVRIFDGMSETLRPGSVLISGQTIAEVSADDIEAPSGAQVVDGHNDVLMPGMTDAHWHMIFRPNNLRNMSLPDQGLTHAEAVAEAERTLLRGFTSVRDVGGATFGLKRAIDIGAVPGPRVFPSGAFISQTSGHGDFQAPGDRPLTLSGDAPSLYEDPGHFVVANGRAEVLAAARWQLKKGASQIKIGAGGGIISDFDPVDSPQFTSQEMAAAVQAASDWGTYVCAHVYTPEGVRRAIKAGVRSIEHGHLLDEATVAHMAETDTWLSIQPLEPGDNPLTPAQLAKADDMIGTWPDILRWAKAHGTRVAFGTDLLFNPSATERQNEMLTRFGQVYSPVEVLKIAISGNAELPELSGKRNPYRQAPLGVVKPGAWADLLIVDGDPTDDMNILAKYETAFTMVMKGGEVFKNLL